MKHSPFSSSATKSLQHIASRKTSDNLPVSHEQVELDNDCISEPHIETLGLQRKMLQKVKGPNINTIAAKNTFDTVGSNGIFQASPAVMKFAGFEANKTHTLKLRIINNSPAP